MTVWKYPIELYDKQRQAVAAPVDEVLFGGSLGGGKTEMILKHMVDICCLVGNAKTLVIRRSFPELVEIAGRLKKRIPPELATYNKSDHVFRFHHNGAELHLGYLDSEDDATRYQGQEYVKVGFDELTHYDKDWVALVVSRIRSTGQIAADMTRHGFHMGMLAASNPGGRGHCVPYGEVLTPAGWVDIRTMQVGDPVYGVNQDGNLVPTVVEQVHQHNAPRTIEVNGRGTHMHMTPEHKVAKVGGVRSAKGTKFSLVPWKDLPGQATVLRTIWWEGHEHGPVTVEDTSGLRKSRTPQPDTLTAEQYAELMGWFLSEGCLVDRDRAISIAQMKPEQRRHIKAFLDSCGFTQSWSQTQVTLYARAWWEHFKDLNLGLCRDKHIPQGLKDATRPVLERLFVALMDGDGHWVSRGRSGAYFTTSKQLADDVTEVALKLGYVVQVGSRQRENRAGLSWHVNFKTVKSGGTEYLTGNHVYEVGTSTRRRSDTVTHDHEVPLPVYCIGVPEHHAFLIRQRGSVWVSGNSWVKETFIDPAPDGEPFTGDDGVRRVFVRSSLYDNPFIDHGDYVRRLGALDPERKRALIEGDWSIPAGTRFPQFRERVHVIRPEDFPIPPVGVVRCVGVDYGINDPFAAVWAAKVGDTIVVYRDHVQDGLAASQQAGRVLELESEEERLHSEVTVALDPNGWARNPHFGGKKLTAGADEAPLGSIAYSFRQALGDRVVKGWNARVQGWSIFDELMVERDTGMVDEHGGAVRLPRILIYDTCRELIRFMSSAPRAKRDPQDVNTDWKHDHVGDAARYCLAELMGLSYRRQVPASERLRLDAANRSVSAGMQSVAF